MILLGTSGFSYADWRGGFYPAGLPARDMLAYYARHFSACEINSTYYRPLDVALARSLVAKSGGRVRFTLKAHRSMTHERTAGPADYRSLSAALQPLKDGGTLGCLLFQFPFAFGRTPPHQAYLEQIRDRLPDGLPWVVEFRHRSWSAEDIGAWMRGVGAGWVNVDEPPLKGLLPPGDQVTGRVGYVRFHGRNREAWFKRPAEPWERYNYLYTEAELREWLPRLRSMEERTETTFVFFNNHWQSQAVVNAKMLARLLGMPDGSSSQATEPELPFPG